MLIRARDNECDHNDRDEAEDQDRHHHLLGPNVHGLALQRLRHRKAWTLEVAARESSTRGQSLSAAWLSRLENGKVPLTPRSEQAICELYDISGEELRELIRLENGSAGNSPASAGLAPPPPLLLVGREPLLAALRARLTTGAETIAAQGMPGIGKSTLVAALAHDPELAEAYPDGLLWAALGPEPDLAETLRHWLRSLGDGSLAAEGVASLRGRLASRLRLQRRLLLIDDVWRVEHGEALRVGGARCAHLFTSRDRAVCAELVRPANLLSVPRLTEEGAWALLRELAPECADADPEPARALLAEVEGLPLAIQVLGRLLRIDYSYRGGPRRLLAEIQHGSRLLESTLPADMRSVSDETTPTIAVLLRRSTDRLDEPTRRCFAALGAFEEKPAILHLDRMGRVWQRAAPGCDAGVVARTLWNRGLIERLDDDRFQIHAVLKLHARSMIQ